MTRTPKKQINLEFPDEPPDMLLFERELWQKYTNIAGIDEAGRGPLAGPVIAATVIIPHNFSVEGIKDSKKLSAMQREKLYTEIMSHALSVGIGSASHEEIDALNILQATYLAMNRAVDNLKIVPDYLLIDGNGLPRNNFPKKAIVKGDNRSISIAAASIIAKVTRDRLLDDFDKMWPVYNFARHKGYPTREHILAIQKHGYCPIHRRTFQVKGT
jgi:ribonuclease HII